jgi:hypothetical protein
MTASLFLQEFSSFAMLPSFTAIVCQLVCFGGHFVTADHTLSTHLLVGWICLSGFIFKTP